MRLVLLIPVFNGASALQRSLASVAGDEEPFDVLVVDDGSDVPVVVPARLGCHEVTVLRHDENRGVAQALNTGVAWILARGFDAVARLDAGDVNEPGRMAAQRAFLQAHPDVAMVGAWTRHVDVSLRPLYTTRYPVSAEDIRRCFHYRSAFSHPACMIRASTFERVGRYGTEYALGEDYELFWRVARAFACANLPQVLVTRVEDPRSLTHTRRGPAARTRLMLQMRHFAWGRLDCWLGLLRSLGVLVLPPRAALLLKRAAGTIG